MQVVVFFSVLEELGHGEVEPKSVTAYSWLAHILLIQLICVAGDVYR